MSRDRKRSAYLIPRPRFATRSSGFTSMPSFDRPTFGTFEPDPLCVLFSLKGADGRQFACLLGDEVEAALLALLRDRERARRNVDIASGDEQGNGTS